MTGFGQRRVTVQDWSVLSGLGVGRDDFTRGFLAAPDAAAEGRLLDGFDATTLIGKKGTRTLDRMTSLVIATAGMVLAGRPATPGSPDAPERPASIGLVLGTSTGSVASITDFTRDTFVRERPYLVNPANFPNTVMNSSAGRTAIWYKLRGPNSTIAAGHLTGLVALRYATRMIRLGYADTLLVGAVEEVSTAVSVAVAAVRKAGDAAAGSGSTTLGEGCVFFLLDGQQAANGAGIGSGSGAGSGAGNGTANGAVDSPADAAEIVDFEFGVTEFGAGAGPPAAGLARTIRSLLARTGVAPQDVWLTSLAQSGDGDLDEAELAAVDEVLGGAGRRVVAAERTGNSFSALGAFQLAAALAVAGQDRPAGAPTRPCLLTSLGTDGSVGCALVRL